MELRGRWALVTGGARRVGRAIALELARQGAHVVVHYNTSAADAAETVRAVEACGVRAAAIPAELGDAAAVAGLARAAEACSGGVAVLVNSASNYIRCAFDDLTPDVWDRSLD